MACEIPVVDFASVLAASGGGQRERNGVIQELHAAFTTVGFVFIQNHGISEALIARAFSLSADFFGLSLADKVKYRVASDNDGYVHVEEEAADPSKPGDLKECFNVCSLLSDKYPDAEMPSFRPLVEEFYKACSELSLLILQLMTEALNLPESQFFVKRHAKIGDGADRSFTTLRFLYYPPVTSHIKPGQLRCGEHVDYGSVTLLFQSPIGGLQVKRVDGSYIDIPYIQGTVLVNLGALMQNWTSDIYQARPHRVLVPEAESKRREARQSIAFFVHPDNDVLVECIDGSNKYPAVTAAEDTRRRLDRTYI